LSLTEKPNPVESTLDYVDRIFGPGMGARHLLFLERLENAALRETILRYHALEADTRWLSLEENYLIGVCVLCTAQQFDTAAMFTKTLLHLGTPKQKILEAVGRLHMWVGGLAAAQASFLVQRAIREYERTGLDSMAVWFPPLDGGRR
jgi:hypothetical protein